MKILYCTNVLPSPRRTGGEIASQSMIDAIRNSGHEVLVLGYRRPDCRHEPASWEIEVGRRPIETDGAGGQAYRWLASAFMKGRPYSSQKFWSPEYSVAVQTQLDSGDFGAVVIDHAQMGFLANLDLRGLPFVLVAHNVEWKLYQEQARTSRSFLRRMIYTRETHRMKVLEKRIAVKARGVWTLTKSDADWFRTIPGVTAVRVFGLPGIPLTDSDEKAGQEANQFDIGLIGTWTWEANAAGLRWFAADVLGKISPDLRVAVAGKGADFIDPARCAVLGFVPSALSFMRSCKVLAVPSIAGSGVQIKTLDAIASGKPIVATSVALRGIDSPPGAVVRADEPERFAQELMRLAKEGCGSATRASSEWAAERLRVFERGVADSLSDVVKQ